MWSALCVCFHPANSARRDKSFWRAALDIRTHIGKTDIGKSEKKKQKKGGQKLFFFFKVGTKNERVCKSMSGWLQLVCTERGGERERTCLELHLS